MTYSVSDGQEGLASLAKNDLFVSGRYPFLGGRFSIMFYTITKRIAQSALAFLIMLIAFSFAFFVINSGTESDKFENPGKSLLKIFVMVLGIEIYKIMKQKNITHTAS